MLAAALSCPQAHSASVDVKYRGVVSLAPFSCIDVESSFIKRVCYDKAYQYQTERHLLSLLRNRCGHGRVTYVG
jgi:hypothetical protein